MVHVKGFPFLHHRDSFHVFKSCPLLLTEQVLRVQGNGLSLLELDALEANGPMVGCIASILWL